MVRAIVTADRALYPDDLQGYRRGLVEALRRRGIYPDSVSALTDNALVWPAPPLDLDLSDGKPRVPLEELLLDATMKLDVAGKLVEVTKIMGDGQDEPEVPADAPRDSRPAFTSR